MHFKVCSVYVWASLVAQWLKRLLAMPETQVRSLGWEDPLEKEVATHSSTLAWRIPWTEEPGGLQSTVSQRVGHDWATSLSVSVCAHIYTVVFIYLIDISPPSFLLHFPFFLKKVFIYLSLAVLGLHCCAQAFSSCWEWGLFCSCTVQASHCRSFSCCRVWALAWAGFRSCGT